jgi:hypothetical protein
MAPGKDGPEFFLFFQIRTTTKTILISPDNNWTKLCLHCPLLTPPFISVVDNCNPAIGYYAETYCKVGLSGQQFQKVLGSISQVHHFSVLTS